MNERKSGAILLVDILSSCTLGKLALFYFYYFIIFIRLLVLEVESPE